MSAADLPLPSLSTPFFTSSIVGVAAIHRYLAGSRCRTLRIASGFQVPSLLKTLRRYVPITSAFSASVAHKSPLVLASFIVSSFFVCDLPPRTTLMVSQASFGVITRLPRLLIFSSLSFSQDSSAMAIARLTLFRATLSSACAFGAGLWLKIVWAMLRSLMSGSSCARAA